MHLVAVVTYIQQVCRSPTPYEALCLGVPFINPIMDVSANLFP